LDRSRSGTDPATLPPGLQPGGRFPDWEAPSPRYVVTDVDGTLLGREGRLTEAVIDALQRAAEAGLRVGFATGRMPAAVRPLW
jgi:hypothetical protein